jgi:hypothetical protein
VAGHVRLELRNVVANYPFESSRGFPGSKPNSGHRDYSRLSCGVGEAQLGLRWQELPRFSADPFRLAGVRCIAALWRAKNLLRHRSDRPKRRLTTDQMAFVAGRHVALA